MNECAKSTPMGEGREPSNGPFPIRFALSLLSRFRANSVSPCRPLRAFAAYRPALSAPKKVLKPGRRRALMRRTGGGMNGCRLLGQKASPIRTARVVSDRTSQKGRNAEDAVL